MHTYMYYNINIIHMYNKKTCQPSIIGWEEIKTCLYTELVSMDRFWVLRNNCH